MWTENHNHMMYVSWDKKCNRQFFCHSEPFFALSPHYWPPKFKFEKYEGKKSWRYYPFTQVHHKWRSYDVSFLRFKAQLTDFFCHFGPFLPFDPPSKTKNQHFEKKKKKAWRYHHFTFLYHKRWSYNVRFLRYGVRQNFLSFLTIFLPFYPLTTLTLKILKSEKKMPGYIIILQIRTKCENLWCMVPEI